MTVQELIDRLNMIEDKTKEIHTASQGFTTLDDPDDEYEINIYDTQEYTLIADGCGGYEGKHRRK